MNPYELSIFAYSIHKSLNARDFVSHSFSARYAQIVILCAQHMGRTEGICRICKLEGTMDEHHIISQNYCKINSWDWLLEDKGNIVKLCRRCHKLTTSALYREKKEKKDNPRAAEFCFKCGHDSHRTSTCIAKKDIDGHEIPNDARQGWWWHEKPKRWKENGKQDVFLQVWTHGIY